jgi:hypothetical protein
MRRRVTPFTRGCICRHLSSACAMSCPCYARRRFQCCHFRSSAPDRVTYLRRPDLGRSLRPEAAAQLQPGSHDLAIVVADGLSALAVERNAIPVLAHLLPALLIGGWTLAPLTIVEQGRVAIGDAIATRLGAKYSLVLIGERPGRISHLVSRFRPHGCRPQLSLQHPRWRRRPRSGSPPARSVPGWRAHPAEDRHCAQGKRSRMQRREARSSAACRLCYPLGFADLL